MNEPVFKSGRVRQAEYQARLHKAGLTRVTVTVPEKDVEKLQSFCAKLRKEGGAPLSTDE